MLGAEFLSQVQHLAGMPPDAFESVCDREAASLGLEPDHLAAAVEQARRARPNGKSPPESDASFWPEPKALPSGLPSVEPFNLRLLPKRLRPWVQDISNRMQCPPDFVAVPAIVGLGSVIGRQLGIRPKCKDDWLVVPNLWGGVVGRPGLLKTPALQEAIRPLVRLEMEAKARHDEELKLHEAEKKLGAAEKKLQEKELQARLKKGTERDVLLAELMEGTHERDAPPCQRYLVNDSTVEKLGEILAANPNGVLVFRDELTGWLRGLERDGREGDRAFYLEAWNGTGRFTYDRIGRGTVDIEAACLSLLGGIQPGPLAAYLGAIKAGGIADDGLMQRFQLVVWPDPSPEWRNVDEWPDAGAKQEAFDSFVSASALVPSDISAEQPEGGGIPFLRFEPDAQVEFDQWRHRLELRLRAGNLHPAFEAHLAKYRSLVPSLALIFHVVERTGGAVSHMSCNRAITFSKYLESHARRLYDLLLRSDASAARALGQRIQAGELGATFTARDIYRREWAELGDRDTVVAALELLEDLDWLRPETTISSPKGGRAKTEYRVNPRLREARP